VRTRAAVAAPVQLLHQLGKLGVIEPQALDPEGDPVLEQVHLRALKVAVEVREQSGNRGLPARSQWPADRVGQAKSARPSYDGAEGE